MSLPTRTFSLLHEKVLKLVQEIEKDNENEKTPEDKNVYSNHWWFDFLNKNPDIKELWRSLPLKQSLSKNKVPIERIKPLNPSKIKKEIEGQIKIEGCKIEEPCQASQINSELTELQSYPPIINSRYPSVPLNYIYNSYLWGNYFDFYFNYFLTQPRSGQISGCETICYF